MSSAVGTFTLVEPQIYHTKLLKAIRQSRRRVLIHAMIGFWDETTAPIFDALLAARQRGVEVQVVFDQYSFLPFALGTPLLYAPTSAYRKRRKMTHQVLQQLAAAGTQVYIIGRIGLNPFKGRYHAKISVADDLCFSFGGVNFYGEAFRNQDFMLMRKDQWLADQLITLVKQTAAGNLKQDVREAITNTDELLLDAGNPGQSIIYETACRLTQQSRRVLYVSQMCPTHELAKLLRQTDYTCYFTRPEQVPLPFNFPYRFDQKRSGLVNSYRGKEYIHAKYMLFELQDGTYAILTGSNNFSWRGVAYGTQEIALHSIDPKLYEQCISYTEHHLI